MEIDFIPILLYSQIYWFVIILAAFVTTLQFSNAQPELQQNTASYSFKGHIGYLLAIFAVIYIGFRPIHAVFVDMGAYAEALVRLQNGAKTAFAQDIGFSIFILVSSKIMNPNFFFLICAIVYVVPVFLACRAWSPSYWQLLFVAFLSSFCFWAYGVNGIRNGLATSLLLYAFSRGSFWPRVLFTALSISFHKSVALPALGFYLASTRLNIKWFFGFWLLSIPLSLIFGSFWESLFSALGFADDRFAMYLTTSLEGKTVTDTRFRFDFLLYSASGVAAGFFYVYKMHFEDFLYKQILGAYLFSNAMWILVIRADFSNRFVYLSWFLMAFIIFYPPVKAKIFQQQGVTALLLLLYCLFSAYMGVFRSF